MASSASTGSIPLPSTRSASGPTGVAPRGSNASMHWAVISTTSRSSAVVVDQPLARFVDRDTLVYDRWYPHDINLVFEAISTGEHLDVWMLPEPRVERCLGGQCS